MKLAALFLLLAPGPLAEVLSQNVPLLTFLQRLPFLLVTVSYGVPVLLIRELVVARELNTVAVALLGPPFQFGSPRHVPFALFFAATMGMVAISAASMARARWRPLPDLLLFGIGDYLTFALFSALLHVASGREPLQAAVASAIFAALFLYLVRAVRRQPSGRSVPPGSSPAGHA